MLSEKQAAFIENYVSNGCNATQAYLSAGYHDYESTRNGVEASKIKHAPAVKQMIDKLIAKQDATGECLLRLENRMQMMKDCYTSAMNWVEDRYGNRKRADLSTAVVLIKELNRMAELATNKGEDDRPVLILKNYADVHLETDKERFTIEQTD